MKNLLILSVLTIILFSCKKSSASSSGNNSTVVKYQINTSQQYATGSYYTADRYNLGFSSGPSLQWNITIPVTTPFSANLVLLVTQNDTATLSILVNNSVVKTQTFINPYLADSTCQISYTIN